VPPEKHPERIDIKAVRAIALLLLLLPGMGHADPPAGYYAAVDPSSPETLRESLHGVIDGHTKIPYTSSSTDTWDVLERADEDPYDSGRILDVYRNRTFPKHGGGNDDYNREHTWPKSYGFPDDNSANKPYSDCHHLFLCDVGYNGDRGNRVFDACVSGCISRPADDYDGQGGVNLTRDGSPVGVWETWIGRRGDVARAMFYMDVRYEGGGTEPDLILTDDVDLIVDSATGSNELIAYMGLLETLLSWHVEDPVDDKERDRNDWVYQYQGNRNPFIDHPEWVASVFLGLPPASAPSDQPIGFNPHVRIAEISPNPFSPATRITCSIGGAGPLRVELYSIEGTLVRTLLHETHRSGCLQVSWDGRDAAGQRVVSGPYYCRLRTDFGSDTRVLLLVR